MASRTELDFSVADYHALPPAQQRATVQAVIRRAHVARSEEIAALACAAGRGLARFAAFGWASTWRFGRSAAASATAAWRRHQERRWRRIAAAQLYAMDDRALQDIGLRRGEIEFAVTGAIDPTRRPRTERQQASFASTDHASPSLQPAQRPDEFILARNGCAG
jgi:uncharacterized protein YjiS (DUF1127 family)